MSHRIVSLLPSATELVCALGAREELVGVSHECDYPPSVAGLPALTRARFAPAATSAGIDRAVRDVVRDALSVYELDVERLRALAPTVIVTQDLCDVCAVSLADVRRAACERLCPGVRIVNLAPTRLADVLDDVRRVARAIDRNGAADALCGDLARRIDAVRKRASKADVRPRVLTLEWIDPPMLGGTWMPDLIEAAGGEPAGVVAGAHAPTVDRARLAALDPDVVVVKPCGFAIERTLAERDRLAEVLPLESWRAAQTGRIYVADGNQYFNRPGPRLIDSLEILAACVHPDLFGGFRRQYPDAVVRFGRDRSARPWR